jgi:hypothetical protein
MSYPPETTGLGAAAFVIVSPYIQIGGIGETYQLEPTVADIYGYPVPSTGKFTCARFDRNRLAISDSGCITALCSGVSSLDVVYTDARGSRSASVHVYVPQPQVPATL